LKEKEINFRRLKKSMSRYLSLIILCLVSSTQLKAQQYLDLSQKQTLLLQKKDKKNKPTLHFDEKGRCDIEGYQFVSKTDFEKKLQQILDIQSYEWIKINENQFVSNLKGQRLIEFFDEAAPYQVRILRTAWSRELYELLLKK
jgi:biopolymer transport protein ExbD